MNFYRMIPAAILLVSAVAGCSRTKPVQVDAGPMAIVVLPDVRSDRPFRKHVMLQLDYGMIVTNMAQSGQAAYYLFCRREKRIVKTGDAEVFLRELEKIPDGSRIDMVSKCTVSFYSQYGVDIEKQHAQIMAKLERKKCVLVRSLDQDPRHASFCYCEGGFTILDKYVPKP